MANISPGVYTKIIDLSTYVQAVPSSIGFIPMLTEKGRDNELLFLGGRSELISEFGEPSITKYGKNYGQGPYEAYNFLGESGALYVIRCLPTDATFSNIRLDYTATDTTATISITYVDSVNTKAEIKSNLTANAASICMLYPIGRGEYYNKIGVRITEYSNPLDEGVYVLDIYEKQSDGDDVIIESFEVSFDPNAKDNSGDSLFISYILETYSSVLRAEMLKTGDASYSDGYTNTAKVFDKNIGTVEIDVTEASAYITDNKQDFSDWEGAGTGSYVIITMDGTGNKLWGWLGAAGGDDDQSCAVYMDKNLTTRGWNGNNATYNDNSTITYVIKKNYASMAQAFTSSDPVPLKKGSDGSLLDASGDLDTSIATQVLSQAYAGTLVEEVLDTENYYFSLVFDAGYPSNVKTSISSLVQTRRDCVAILDNGDNASYTTSMTTRQNTHTFNTYYVALYEEYNKVYDIFTGTDVWFSPVYHMSYILPRNDTVAELWYAAAGFNRASIDSIKELRFNPRLGQRDQMYMKQLNPIVHLREGFAPFSQLTSQARASALQDLNIVRLILYCKVALERYCRGFLFEQLDEITMSQISGGIIEFLEDIKKRRGLYSYSVSVYATPYQKKRKTCSVDIMLEPVRTLEKIELNFYVK